MVGQLVKLKKERLTFIFFLLLHFFIFFVSLFFQGVSGDLIVYFLQAGEILERKKPYLDFPAYPPLSLILFLLPRFFTFNFSLYALFFAIEIFLIDLIGLVFIFKLLEKTKIDTFFGLSFYTFSLFFLFPLLTNRYDLFPAILTFLALYYFLDQKKEIAWVFLILGGLAKIYPFFIIPLFLIFHFLTKDYKTLIKAIGILGIFLLFLSAIFTPKGLFSIISNQIQRPLQIETFFSSLVLIGNFLGFFPLEKEISHSVNIRSFLADFLAKYSFLIIIWALFGVYFIYFQNLKKFILKNERKLLFDFPFVNYIGATILVTILFSNTFSPQFLFWFSPFVPFIKGKWRNFSALIFLFSCFLTTYIYPFNYLALYNSEPVAIFFLLVRNLLLLATVFLLLKST